MDEPVGTAVDEAPWAEARGPRLPDALTRAVRSIPFVGWLFLLITVADAAWNARDYLTRSLSILPEQIPIDIVAWIPSIAVCLFGAALFTRHRHAWSTHRLLVIGIIALVVVEALQVASVVWSEQLAAFARDPDDLSPIGPGTLVMAILTSSLRVIGLVLLARGIFAIRQFEEDLNADRRMTIITLVSIPLIIASVVSVVLYVSTLDLPSLPATTVAYLILGALVSALAVAAFAYLTTIVTAGWSAHERPRGAWRLAALAIWLIFLALYLGTLVQVIALVYAVGATAQSQPPTWTTDAFNVSAAVRAVGYIVLVLAFFLGFPSPRDDEDDDDLDDEPAAR